MEEIDSYGLQSVEESGLHAMKPDMEPGVCDSPPEQDAELHAMQPVELVQQGSQPTSTTVTVKVNAVKPDHKSNLFIKKGRITRKITPSGTGRSGVSKFTVRTDSRPNAQTLGHGADQGERARPRAACGRTATKCKDKGDGVAAGAPD
ncbi:hypothetical protein PF008_g26743 [Phytophthora fragariae]|uniref:Uncharacterized protein n=1 Tax=Phytophthora fragariae TaxID=53985 RepID=A0A6G0QG52_9STRA|nr:hypothetical protein PF008_g26743 [Phytophthora fragariae]